MRRKRKKNNWQDLKNFDIVTLKHLFQALIPLTILIWVIIVLW
jgi:hypothetical protein